MEEDGEERKLFETMAVGISYAISIVLGVGSSSASLRWEQTCHNVFGI